MTNLETKPMNLTEAVKIFEAFNNWCIGVLDPHNPYSQFSEYPADQVLEAQGIVLNEAKQNLAFEMSALAKNERLLDSEK
jgi:hypothetical protein